MSEERAAALLKTGLLGMVAVFSFGLGRLTLQFTGDGLSWFAVIGNVALIGWAAYMLMRDFWKPNT